MKIILRLTRSCVNLLATVVLVASCGAISSSTTTDSVNTSVKGPVEISVTVGVDSGADRIVQIPLGASVRVTLINPEAVDQYHLHGYEIESASDVPAGAKVVIEFEATKPGSFEIESHISDQVLIVLNIS
jgi:hypothetical protein